MGWPRHKVTVVWRPCAIHPSCTQEHRQGDLCPTCKLELGARTLALAPAPALLAPAGHGAVNVDHPAPTLALATSLCDWGGAWAGHSAPAGTGIGTLALCTCRPRRRPRQHHDQHRRSDTGTRPGATAAATAATGTTGHCQHQHWALGTAPPNHRGRHQPATACMVVGVVAAGRSTRSAAQHAAGCACAPEHVPRRRCWPTATPAPPNCN